MTDRQPFAFKGVCFSSISCGHNQCYQIWRNFATLAKFKSLKDILGIVLVWYLANVCTYFGNFYATGQIFNDVNGQNVKSNVVIWSHWPQFARFLPPTLFLTFRPPRLFFVVAFHCKPRNRSRQRNTIDQKIIKSTKKRHPLILGWSVGGVVWGSRSSSRMKILNGWGFSSRLSNPVSGQMKQRFFIQQQNYIQYCIQK